MDRIDSIRENIKKTKRWTKKSTIVPRLVWNDAGTGGRAGSIWIVNELGLIWVKSGHDPPEGPFYTVKGEKFYVGGHGIRNKGHPRGQ